MMFTSIITPSQTYVHRSELLRVCPHLDLRYNHDGTEYFDFATHIYRRFSFLMDWIYREGPMPTLQRLHRLGSLERWRDEIRDSVRMIFVTFSTLRDFVSVQFVSGGRSCLAYFSFSLLKDTETFYYQGPETSP